MKLFAMLTGIMLCCLILTMKAFAGNKNTYKIETADIDHFWQAYDRLVQAHNRNDSVTIIQQLYLDKMTKYGKKYIGLRQYTAPEYVSTLSKYPKYFVQLRKKTGLLLMHKPGIDTAFSKLAAIIPGFNYPDVCFAIGCFRGGGTKTKSKDALLIGCEIALADLTMDVSEFKGALYTLISHADGDITALIAHESVHCRQWNGRDNSLLSIALAEGGADFFTQLALNTNINKAINAYGLQRECELWKEFDPQMHSTDISQWFYNTARSNGRPADLGYFIGRRICEAYYDKEQDKKKAVMDLLNRGKYLEVMQESGYTGNCN